MRNDIQEPGRGRLTSALHASVVDAALDDDQTLAAPTANARRDMSAATGGADASRIVVDRAHPSPAAASATDDGLLRQLHRQLELLEVQQNQIRRLLEQTEQRSSRSASRLDR